MDAKNETIVVDRVIDGGTIRLAGCHVEHDTATARTLWIDSK